MMEHKEQGKLILYLDETNFTPRKHSAYSYALKYMNQETGTHNLQVTTMSAIVCINQEYGIVDHMIVPGAVNAVIFLDYINQLFHTLEGREDVVIFMDNLRVHHTKQVKERLDLFGWTAVFNAAYSSEIHCIERVFARVKFNYKKLIRKEVRKVSDQYHKNMI